MKCKSYLSLRVDWSDTLIRPTDGQMQKLPTEASGSNLRTTYMVTQASQYHEIPPPNTLEAQTDATAGHTSTVQMLPHADLLLPVHRINHAAQRSTEDDQSSRQVHVEEPPHPCEVIQRHSLHDPETPLPGLSTCPATSPSACTLASDLELKLPGLSKGRAKRKTCMDKE